MSTFWAVSIIVAQRLVSFQPGFRLDVARGGDHLLRSKKSAEQAIEAILAFAARCEERWKRPLARVAGRREDGGALGAADRGRRAREGHALWRDGWGVGEGAEVGGAGGRHRDAVQRPGGGGGGSGG